MGNYIHHISNMINSGGVLFKMPTADGSNGQVKTIINVSILTNNITNIIHDNLMQFLDPSDLYYCTCGHSSFQPFSFFVTFIFFSGF